MSGVILSDSDVARIADAVAQRLQVGSPTLDTTGAMARLGYKSGKRFWQAVRRLGIPYSRLSARQCIFRTSEIDAVLARRQVGNTRIRRAA